MSACKIFMYNMRYKDVVEDDVLDSREREKTLFDRSVALLRKAQSPDATADDVYEAVKFTRTLWLILIDDLGQSDNGLPEALKASLISIGFFILKEIQQLQDEQVADFDALIEISESIRDGLASVVEESHEL